MTCRVPARLFKRGTQSEWKEMLQNYAWHRIEHNATLGESGMAQMQSWCAKRQKDDDRQGRERRAGTASCETLARGVASRYAMFYGIC